MNKSLLAVAAVIAAVAFTGAASAEKIDGADQGGLRLTATFSGLTQVDTNGVPNGDPDATGTAVVTLNYGLGEICVDYQVQNIDLTNTITHIHRGVAGQNGPAVIGFGAFDSSGRVTNCVPADRTLIAEIRDNPEGFYAHAHNFPAHPAGVVRGQLSR